MLRVIVLGSAAGGGVPQWNCGCRVCRAARDAPELQRTQAAIAVSADDRHWFLINASPDLRAQINATPQLHPARGALRDSPIAGVILTNGEIDAIAGLLTLREGSPFAVYAHADVLATLDANSIFNVLDRARVPRIAIEPEVAFVPRLPDGTQAQIEIVPFAVPGKPAWYLEGSARTTTAGDTLGLEIRDARSRRSLFVLTACAAITPELKARLDGAALILFDGTLWRDDELIASRLGQKTGQQMGHIAMSGDHGAIAALASLAIGRKLFLHINNSNPVLLSDSAERRAAEDAGWEIPDDGWELTL
jgi:pyrroloquinoline quinone biosynthesis protein B